MVGHDRLLHTARVDRCGHSLGALRSPVMMLLLLPLHQSCLGDRYPG